jgi:DNA-directed RNA polymerase subunit RPC12/RpoP
VSSEQDGPDFGCTECGYQIVLREPDIRCPMCGIESWVPVARSRRLAQADPGREVLGETP